MKYAVTGPRGAINRISDKEPQHVGEHATVVEITGEQAATVEAGRSATPPVRYFLIGGELVTQEQFRLSQRPLVDRLKPLFERQPAEARALFWPARAAIESALKAGDNEAAKIALQGIDVPAELVPVKEAMLAEFDK